ncbi:MAG: type II secretion system F family protein [Anaerolineae bacterium]|nr:type II secretion system F family protein [Anaerolineae bacterium]
MVISSPLIVATLLAFAILLIFMALWIIFQKRDPVNERLKEFGLDSKRPESSKARPSNFSYRSSGGRKRLGSRLAFELKRADIPLTAAEYSIIIIILAILGFALGTWRVNWLLGIAIAIVFGLVPIFVMKSRQRRRLKIFTNQIPDMLTLLVGALRAGYGLSQAIEVLVERLGPPSSTEMANVMRAVNLGQPIRYALQDAADRLGSDDFNLVVVAINVQFDTGGNLAESLETIAATVRHRLRILNEIRVLTAQQRMTGYILALLPVGLTLVMFLINPDFISQLFAPGWIRILPLTAVVMQVAGFFFIRRIVDIKV